MSYVAKKCEALQIKISDRLVSDVASLVFHCCCSLSETFDFDFASPAKCEATTLSNYADQKKTQAVK